MLYSYKGVLDVHFALSIVFVMSIYPYTSLDLLRVLEAKIKRVTRKATIQMQADQI